MGACVCVRVGVWGSCVGLPAAAAACAPPRQCVHAQKKHTLWNGPTRCSPAYDWKFSRTISEMMRRGGGRFGACCCCCKGASCGSMAAREREKYEVRELRQLRKK